MPDAQRGDAGAGSRRYSWRIAFTSRSLNGVWAAVNAGLGVTVRTAAGLPPGTAPLAPELLPALGQLGVVLHRAEDQPSAAVQRLAQIVVERIGTNL